MPTGAFTQPLTRGLSLSLTRAGVPMLVYVLATPEGDPIVTPEGDYIRLFEVNPNG